MRYLQHLWVRCAALLLLALLAACSPAATPTSPAEPTQPATPAPSALAGTEWQLETLGGEPPVSGTRITLSLEQENAGGYSGCNQYGGRYTASEDGALRFSELANTLMACEGPEGVMEQETAYLAALNTIDAYSLDAQGRLSLHADGTEAMTFTAVEELPMNPEDLVGTAWKLTEMDSEPPVAGTAITLGFPTASTLQGHAGWRDYSGTYEAEGDDLHLRFLEMAPALRIVPETAMTQEGIFTTRLGQATHYRLGEDALEVVTAPGQSLRFESLPEGADPYVPTTWVLESFVAGGESTPALEGSRVTAIVDADMVQGTAGCNSYSAAVSTDGSFLKIESPVRTEMACLDPEGVMEQEDRFLETLSQVTAYRVRGDVLHLETEDGRALVLRAEAPAA
ncbi:MAG: META domain-containing protein [Anaerolineae bacterium]